MIEKMKFLSITGPKEDIDRVVNQYLSKYEIQIENALSELKTVKDLRPYIEINPYKELFTRASRLVGSLNSGGPAKTAETPAKGTLLPDSRDISIEKASETVIRVDKALADFMGNRTKLEGELDTLRTSHNKILPFRELDYDIRSILHFRHIRFRFGRIPREYYAKFEKVVYESLDTILYKCHEDENYVSIVYFVPAVISKRIDAIYTSLHFERFIVPDEYNGTPGEAIDALEEQIRKAESELAEMNAQINRILEDNRQDILDAYTKLNSYNTNFNVRKLAACTNHDVNTFYILCGWMTERDAEQFRKELELDDKTFCLVEDDHNNLLTPPPTKLKNPKLFRPFEMFIKMYGLPAYGELDPTILIAVTYSFLFGFMFGDVGQGLFLLCGGYALYRVKKMDLAAVVSCCGFFSTIFGFLFGSVFGFEDILHPLWLRPAAQMMNLPFIGKLNTVFIVAVALGMGIIVLTMILNIINSVRFKDPEKSWFDTNGLAGLVFYGSVLAVVVLFMMGKTLPAAGVLAVMFGIPLIIIFLKEPLAALVKKQAGHISESRAMFFVQGFFEMFEMLLSYFSNTLSFVRVGAFAVSHAAMMEVVMMLAGAESGAPNWAVVIIGNLFVCAMEGLIVGIQVLRLEYYEIFSRFYKGSGREFRPYGKA
ncbi:V-type ATP synthase subunit I [Clostridium transplantifaecale]|uniref:V-type ATP synthase subunit I n=1 Tax=Clostridium transplantifaecale TaxID=2479838 RepID=UPI000F6445AB|nr:V-type ATPase 116kDa subunit family protein [Clostridium transplantifaecale]